MYYPRTREFLVGFPALHFLHIRCRFNCIFLVCFLCHVLRAFLISKTCMHYLRSAYPCISYHASTHSKHFNLDILPPFYHTLLKYWQEYNADKFSEDQCIHNKVIWNNSRILIRDRPVFFKPLFDAKITRIKQFLKEDNTFLSLDELIDKVNISIPFTLYYGLIAAIPTEWKNILKIY